MNPEERSPADRFAEWAGPLLGDFSEKAEAEKDPAEAEPIHAAPELPSPGEPLSNDPPPDTAAQFSRWLFENGI